MKKLLLLFVITCVFLAVGCSYFSARLTNSSNEVSSTVQSHSNNDFDYIEQAKLAGIIDKFGNNLAVGMPEEDVRKLMGDPSEIIPTELEGEEYVRWEYGGRLSIEFKDGVVNNVFLAQD